MKNTQTNRKINKQMKAQAVVTPTKVNESIIESGASSVSRPEDMFIKTDEHFLSETKYDTKFITKLKKEAMKVSEINNRDTNFFVRQYSHLGNLENLIASTDKMSKNDKIIATRIAAKLDQIIEQKAFDWGVEDLWTMLKKHSITVKDEQANWLNPSASNSYERILGFSKDDLINYFQIPQVKKFKNDYLNKAFYQTIDSLKSSVITVANYSKIGDELQNFINLFAKKVEKDPSFVNMICDKVYYGGEYSEVRKDTKIFLKDIFKLINIHSVQEFQGKIEKTLKTINVLTTNFDAIAEKDSNKVFIIDLGIKNE